MFNVGPLELMVILIVALLVVGPTKLPEVGRSIGRGLREFRRAQDEVQRTLRLSLDDDDDEPPTRAMRSSAGDAQANGSADAATEALAERSTQRAAARSGGDVDDVAKTLGRGLAELRRAKEELQRTFRVDLDDDADGSRGR